MIIRAAQAKDADQLTEIAVAAKKHWGYSDEAMVQWHDTLKITAQAIALHPTFVMEDDGHIVGFYMLWTDSRLWELEHMWVAPKFMRKGIGKALLAHAIRLVRYGGGDKLHIDADPNAEPFYLACGARRVGAVAAPIPEVADRVRPVLEIDLRERVA